MPRPPSPCRRIGPPPARESGFLVAVVPQLPPGEIHVRTGAGRPNGPCSSRLQPAYQVQRRVPSGRFSPARPQRERQGRRLALVPALLGLIAALILTGPSLALLPQPVLAQDATPAAAPTPTPDPLREPLERAVEYLLAQQAEDGGFVGFAGTADPGTTADAVVALKAAGFRGITVDPAITAALVYLEPQAAAYAAIGPGQAAKLALAAVAAGRDPAAFGGVDLLAAATAPLATPTAGTPTATPAIPGGYGTGIFDHALVMLALAAVHRPVPPEAIAALRATQLADGSWAFDGSTEPGAGDSNTTALVVQALVASGNGTDPMVAAALDYLRAVQTVTGQFAFQATEPLVADANSTALAVQAIVATGQDPTSPDDWRNAVRGLAAFQNVSGAFRYQDAEPADNLLATLQAIPALAGIPLPVGVACEEEAADAAPGATPVIALPAPGRGQVACVALEPAA